MSRDCATSSRGHTCATSSACCRSGRSIDIVRECSATEAPTATHTLSSGFVGVCPDLPTEGSNLTSASPATRLLITIIRLDLSRSCDGQCVLAPWTSKKIGYPSSPYSISAIAMVLSLLLSQSANTVRCSGRGLKPRASWKLLIILATTL